MVIIRVMSWYTDAPERWEREKVIAEELMQNVDHGIDENGCAWIRGDYRLLSVHGHEYGIFGLRIEYPDGFPRRGRHPRVYLVARPPHWRNGLDSHIESDWRLCLYVPFESGIDTEDDGALREVFCAVHTFLFRQKLYQDALVKQQITGGPAKWPGPDRAHGIAGIVEAIRQHGRPKPNDPCPCGSNKRFKHCCARCVDSYPRLTRGCPVPGCRAVHGDSVILGSAQEIERKQP